MTNYIKSIDEQEKKLLAKLFININIIIKWIFTFSDFFISNYKHPVMVVFYQFILQVFFPSIHSNVFPFDKRSFVWHIVKCLRVWAKINLHESVGIWCNKVTWKLTRVIAIILLLLLLRLMSYFGLILGPYFNMHIISSFVSLNYSLTMKY